MRSSKRDVDLHAWHQQHNILDQTGLSYHGIVVFVRIKTICIHEDFKTPQKKTGKAILIASGNWNIQACDLNYSQYVVRPAVDSCHELSKRKFPFSAPWTG